MPTANMIYDISPIPRQVEPPTAGSKPGQEPRDIAANLLDSYQQLFNQPLDAGKAAQNLQLPRTGKSDIGSILFDNAMYQIESAVRFAGNIPTMLFFGCRHPDQDFLYADELKALAASGITELLTAFSRADGPKTYVQHQVAAQKDRVWSLIEQGAIVYVCGDGSKMEPDVKAALVAIYREKSGADADAGLRWIDDLGTRNRYVLDVWAGG